MRITETVNREMVPRTKEGKSSDEGQAVCRSDGRQDPAHHASGLQARAAARVSAAPARGQSHELGEPANDHRLHGGPDDAEAGVRGSPQHKLSTHGRSPTRL